MLLGPCQCHRPGGGQWASVGAWSDGRRTIYGLLLGLKRCFKSTIFFPMMTPIEITPSPCPSQAPRRSACKISPSYVAPFCSLSCEDAKATFAYF